MNEDIKARWVAALRSGEYEQGTDYLCNDGKFCCLGVLSDLAVKDGVIEAPEEITNGLGDAIPGLAFDGERHHLPPAVAEWAGLLTEGYTWDDDGIEEVFGLAPDIDPVAIHDWTEGDKTFSELNDTGKTFAEIADLIEEKL